MKRPEFIARQSGHPKGLLGSLIAKIMAEETAPENDFALDLLDLEKGDHFLDIGTGHGATLLKAAEVLPEGFAAGIDPSKVMVRHAKRRVKPFIRKGAARVELAGAGSIPFPDQSFDKLMTVHTIYFWEQLADPLAEIFRVARPGAIFVVCFRPAEDVSFASTFPKNVYSIRTKQSVLQAMEDSGFKVVRVLEHVEDEGRLAPLVFAVLERPGSAT